MSRRNHPSAFDISFGEDAAVSGTTSLKEREQRRAELKSARPAHRATHHNGSAGSGSIASSSNASSYSANSTRRGNAGLKRPAEHGDAAGPTDKRHRPQHEQRMRYIERGTELRERADLVIFGEEDQDDDGDEDSQPTIPIRILSNFTIYDPKHHNELVSLHELETEGSVRRDFEAVGVVAPLFMNEEDAGQDIDEDDGEQTQQWLRTTSIFRFDIDYTNANEPLYIQTQYAWYILQHPSQQYSDIWDQFYHPRRVCQIIVSAAHEDPDLTWNKFYQQYVNVYDEKLGCVLKNESIGAVSRGRYHLEDENEPFFTLYCVVDDLQDDELKQSPLIKHLLKNASSIPLKIRQQQQRSRGGPPPRRTMPSAPTRPQFRSTNIDLAVLRPEAQQRTHVTPLIDQLATGLFREHMVVVGPPPKPNNSKVVAQKQRNWMMHLLLEEKRDDDVVVSFPAADQLLEEYWKSVTVNGQNYKLGDSIIFLAGDHGSKEKPNIPNDLSKIPKFDNLADYFWIGKIIFIDQKHKTVHIQYYEHASKTFLQNISDSQELFLTDYCGDLAVDSLLAPVTVHTKYQRYPSKAQADLDPLHFFCNLKYNEQEASLTTIPDLSLLEVALPPENCPVCQMHTQLEEEQSPTKIPDGFTLGRQTYHCNDYILFRGQHTCSDNHPPNKTCARCKNQVNPCNIGQILDINFSSAARDNTLGTLTVQLLGRITDISSVCPIDMVKEEQHLFMTDDQMDIPIDHVLRPCKVLHKSAYSEEVMNFYLSLSPCHFYVQYHFPSVNVRNWGSMTVLSEKDVIECGICIVEFKSWMDEMNLFMQRKPLRALDIFAGVGAFSMAMENTAGIKTTHAVEISPSAAETLRKNSPDTIVYNQCANTMLQYAIKSHLKMDVRTPKDLSEAQTPVPAPPKPEDIDCIIAGFPCQPHSQLNMYQKANDRKTHLILNLLSWVDFMKPKYCFFENVRGFMYHKLNAVQANRYSLTGGIDMGGLKFVVRAMIAMGYQVRFALLQAAHYGTPQSRIRFFMIASKQSYPLPAFPAPTHDFPVRDSLEIRLSEETSIRPIIPATETAAFKFITIREAISDLPYFDWKPPKSNAAHRIIPNPENPQLEQTVDALTCHSGLVKCGISGSNFRYRYRTPQTSYQKWSRSRETKDIQHFTRALKEQIVQRVVNIPLRPGADYRSLQDPGLWEWQFANPSSAAAKGGFRPGMYGRLDSDGWFHTTVTNVEPTAKQSWVLHPECKRTLTVRELARSQGFPDWFVFSSLPGDIKTMHRQIGNAVPWPVGFALGRELRDAMFKKWQDDKEASTTDAITIDEE